MPEEIVLLELLKHWKSHKPGDVIRVKAGILPKRMMNNGTAKRYILKKDRSDSEPGGENEKENSPSKKKKDKK